MTGPDAEILKAMRARAYELAETGHYAGWDQSSPAPRAESFAAPPRKQRGDHLFHELVTARCRRARVQLGFAPALAMMQPSG